MTAAPPLPVDEVLPALQQALARSACAVLQAPPGAGKTTRVPLALIDQPWLDGAGIVMLEPRRLAARAAARFMAAGLGERPGGTVGYRVRFDTQVSARTRIEVVTEGVLTRRLQQAPDLPGVGLLIFDEFHERSLDADLGLALALDVQRALRPDLKILVMSATLDGDRVAKLLGDAPVVTSAGRAHAVELRYAAHPPRGELEAAMATTITEALRHETGSLLAFLPGEREIHRLASRLAAGGLLADVDLHPFYGALPPAKQDAAMRPAPAGRRKVVLATTIAETSLTIDGVRLVVDGGLKRVPRFDPRRGMGRLATVQVSRAAAAQRAGRAGRTAAGICYRLWSEAEQRGLVPFDEAEMAQADLAPLVLALAEWGVHDPAAMAWLDPPPTGSWSQAVALLQELGALAGDGGVTAEGRAMAALPLHPRLAHMVHRAMADGDGSLASLLAALLSERDPLSDRSDVDLGARVEVLAARQGGGHAARSVNRRAVEAIHQVARQIRRATGIADDGGDPPRPATAGRVLALAYPDRIAVRQGGDGRYVLSGGGAARLEQGAPLAAADCLVVAMVSAGSGDGRIRLAAPIARAEIETMFLDAITENDEVSWDPRQDRVVARRQRRLGAAVLQTTPQAAPDGAMVRRAMCNGVRQLGPAALPWTDELRQWQQRVLLLRRLHPDAGWPDVSDAGLMASLEHWLAPFLGDTASRAALARVDLAGALNALLPWPLPQSLSAQAPRRLRLDNGVEPAVQYDRDGAAVVRMRLQDAFGLKRTPVLAGGAVDVVLELLSPADRPLARTSDLANFWTQIYPQVRAEMRGRYPKHRWPDDPINAAPGVRRGRD